MIICDWGKRFLRIIDCLGHFTSLNNVETSETNVYSETKTSADPRNGITLRCRLGGSLRERRLEQVHEQKKNIFAPHRHWVQKG